MKLEQVVDPGFVRAVEDLSDKDVSVLVAYKLSELLEKVQAENVKYQRLRIALVDKYGTKDSTGKLKINKKDDTYVIKNKKAFDKEYSAFVKLDVELPKIKMADLQELKISGRALSQLKPVISI